MKSKVLGLLAVGLLAGPMAAIATPVTWEVQGSLTIVDGSYAAMGLAVGDTFSVLINFDTAAARIGGATNASGGSRSNYAADTLSFQFFIGNLCTVANPCLTEFDSTLPNPGSIIVRDNFLTTDFGDLVDGITFGLNGFNQGQPETNQFVMRGPVLDIFNSSALPGTPDPRLASLRSSVFQAVTGANASVGFLEGQLSSIRSVPEPGTLALLGLGLAGLGMSRRRKAA